MSQAEILIEREKRLVLKGKDATRLVELLEELQLDPLERVFGPSDLETLLHAYIMAGKYNDLNGMLQRYQVDLDYLAYAKEACLA